MPFPVAPADSATAARIAIIGLGPRGASLIERLGAQLAEHPEHPPVTLHLIDDAQPGPGRIWRTDQPRELCMNTLADAVTLFTEPGATVTGPILEGPTLFEWCVLARDSAAEGTAAPAPGTQSAAGTGTVDIPPARAQAYAKYPARPGFAAEYGDELALLRPESHPSRALYGEYLAWFFKRAVSELPPGVSVVHHRARATAIERVGGSPGGDPETSGERITLRRAGFASERTVTVDSVIAATGWLPRFPTAADAELSAAAASREDLTWVRQGSPVEQDLGAVRAGERVIVRGLGMGFFDTLTLLTTGRGGGFVEDPGARGGLRYEPSGREPIVYVTSRRGVPFRAKSLYGALPPRAEQRLLRGVDWGRAARPIDFDAQLWPRIVGDAFLAHAEALRASAPAALGEQPDATLAEIETAIRAAISPIVSGAERPALQATVARVSAAVAPFIPAAQDRFDLAAELDPAAGTFSSPQAFDAWVCERVAADLAEAELGVLSPVKAGLWSVSSARGFAASVGTLGGFDAESRANGAAVLSAVGGMVGSGPPAFRSRELLALAAAGLVHFIGPAASLRVTAEGFAAASATVAGSAVTARALVDAWLHFPDVRQSADPFTRSLVTAGRARPFEVGSRGGSRVATGGMDIDPATGRLVRADGSVDTGVHVAGIPVDDTLHGTVISPMPGTDPPMLRETDRVARSAAAAAFRAAAARSTPRTDGALSA